MRSIFFKTFGNLCLAVLLFISFTCQVLADTKQPTTPDNNQNVKRVAFTDIPGFSEQWADGSYPGMIIDYLREISKFTGWKYEYVEMKADAMPAALENGTVDLIGGTYLLP